MNDKIVEFISNIDSTEYDEFIKNATSNTSLALNRQIKDYDYSWINKLEEYLPFVSNIVNYDYTDTTNNIVLKSYENRFIKTLLYRLKKFLIEELEIIKSLSFTDTKGMLSRIDTTINGEYINVEVKVICTQTEESKKIESYGLSLDERVERLYKLISTLLNSEFIKSLEDISLIEGDIVKTEVLDQELNYRKSFELYECIKSYISSKEKVNNDISTDSLDDKLLISSFIEYELFKNCAKEDNSANVYKVFLERLIEKMVLETSMDEKSFKKMITKKFEDEYSKKKNREKNIQNIFLKNIDNYNKQVKDAMRALKS